MQISGEMLPLKIKTERTWPVVLRFSPKTPGTVTATVGSSLPGSGYELLLFWEKTTIDWTTPRTWVESFN